MTGIYRDPLYVRFDLAGLMRRHRVTVRTLAARMGIPMTRVRAVRNLDRVDYLTYCDFRQAVTGQCVFSPARYEAMKREAAGRLIWTIGGPGGSGN